MKKLTLPGKINSKGKLALHSQDELNAYLVDNQGKRVMVTFRVYQPGTSPALRGYYVNKVVPDCQKALWKQGFRWNLKETEYYLRYTSPICWEETFDSDTGKYHSEIRELVDIDKGIYEIGDFDNSELMEHIDFIKQFAAENLGVFIDDPKTIIK